MTGITLIIPDIHHKWERAEKIISGVGADEVLFLGDYFDDFNDTPDMVLATAEWLEGSVAKKNRTHLFGNHDQSYAFPYKSFRCSGYAQWKQFIIHDNVSPKTWEKIKWFHFLDNRWLLCHAGLHNLTVPDEIKKHYKDRQKFIEELTGWLDHQLRIGFNLAAEGVGSWIFNAGRARWGHQRVGGITWCDYEREFYPLKGINQIVGHTPSQFGVKWTRLTEDHKVLHHPFAEYTPTPEILDNPEISTNICLDILGNMHYGIWDGKQLKVGSFLDF